MSALSYAALLRIPHASRTFGAALLGRLSYGMVSLSLLLSVKAATGSYTAAGAALACFGATSVTLSPVRAGVIDRHGPRRALPPMAAAYALLLAALAVVTADGGTGAAGLTALAAAAGALTPPLGPVMRVLWSDLVPPGLLSRAYSLDSVAEELLLVTGPLLVGAIVTAAPAPVGLAASAALILCGTLALVASPVAGARKGSRAAARHQPVRVRLFGPRLCARGPPGLRRQPAGQRHPGPYPVPYPHRRDVRQMQPHRKVARRGADHPRRERALRRRAQPQQPATGARGRRVQAHQVAAEAVGLQRQRARGRQDRAHPLRGRRRGGAAACLRASVVEECHAPPPQPSLPAFSRASANHRSGGGNMLLISSSGPSEADFSTLNSPHAPPRLSSSARSRSPACGSGLPSIGSLGPRVPAEVGRVRRESGVVGAVVAKAGFPLGRST